MIEEYLEQRLKMSQDLKHYIFMDEQEKAKMIEKEIEKIEILIIKLLKT